MGWVYNLKTPDPHSHIPQVIGVSLTFSIVACLAVILRFYVRLHTKRTPWFDDYAAMFSAVLSVAYAGISVAQTRWGLGLNFKYFPTENVVPFSHVQYAGGPVYVLALLGFKVALLTSYLRIGGFVQAYKNVILGVIVLVVCNQVIFTFLLLFACNPVAKQWDLSIPGTCINTVKSYYGLAGSSLGFDLIIIALPLPVLWKLKLHRKQKIALIILFALGFFVTIIQIIRVFTIKKLQTYTDSEPIVIWSVIEISLGVIVTCVPTYGPLFKAFSSNLNSYRKNRYGQSYGQSYRLETSGKRNTTAPSTRKRNTSQLNSQDLAYDLEDVGDRPYDKTNHTTTIMSMAQRSDNEPANGDTASEEHILPETVERSDMGTDPFAIHTKTEVTIERHGV
ncbi:hypothetical protein ASPWEDRAFT_105046 [Aspergillus wentii DTO 134E9]|uniref:Rhodopsin domain-containing protein n=1 Tax=Aspergillus wentii DTO 134E9 TaxID=1073089 RepID=A0A1L9RTU5_ASPWE|nr:uncharacterized protein ASPWEDRAFT_105046 [Aspergillus wentii DTO 134E9]KAI9933981.1 hypothetical protein MW887_005053 [Aspergillus wentii]OJJ38345.1 hypothetical protein ASPWEDRAFT_105046 [Aspergillus wentii DTO 134E9]